MAGHFNIRDPETYKHVSVNNFIEMAAKTDLSDKIKELQSNGRNMLSLNCDIVTGKLIQLNLV